MSEENIGQEFRLKKQITQEIISLKKSSYSKLY